MNNHKENQIEWEKRGEMIIPKSFKVARLSRASFSKGMTIERIFRVSVEASYEKKFAIDPSDFQFEEHYNKILGFNRFITDTFGHSPNLSKGELSHSLGDVNGLLRSMISDIKSSSRLTLVPRGTIVQVASTVISESFQQNGRGIGDYDGWVICNGQHGTPDLRGRFLVGFDSNRTDYESIGKTGGRSSVILTEANLPSHSHRVNIETSSAGKLLLHFHFTLLVKFKMIC